MFAKCVFISIVCCCVLSVQVTGAPPSRFYPAGVAACMRERCGARSGPVCVIDDFGMTRTFENHCIADLAYCRFGRFYEVLKQGEC